MVGCPLVTHVIGSRHRGMPYIPFAGFFAADNSFTSRNRLSVTILRIIALVRPCNCEEPSRRVSLHSDVRQ
jgi:hypothetical protein